MFGTSRFWLISTLQSSQYAKQRGSEAVSWGNYILWIKSLLLESGTAGLLQKLIVPLRMGLYHSNRRWFWCSLQQYWFLLLSHEEVAYVMDESLFLYKTHWFYCVGISGVIWLIVFTFLLYLFIKCREVPKHLEISFLKNKNTFFQLLQPVLEVRLEIAPSGNRLAMRNFSFCWKC